MPLSTRTIDEWRDRFRAIIRGLITGADTSRGKEYYATAGLLGQLAHAAQGQALYVLRQILPSTAEDEWVVRHGEEHDLDPQPASKATGKVRMLGSAALTQPSGSALQAADGTAYTTTEAATMTLAAFTGKTVGTGSSRRRLVVLPDTSGMSVDEVFTVALPDASVAQCAIKGIISSASMIDLYEALDDVPADGTALTPATGAVVEVEADEAGAQGTKSQGETLTLASPTSGITAATRLIECSGGADAETAEELKARVTARLRTPPAAGNLEHIRQLARTSGVRVADAFVYPGIRGLGTVDVVLWGLPGARIVSTVDVATVQAYLDERLHWADDIVVRACAVADDPDLTITVDPHQGFRPDWSGSFEISSATTTRLTFTTTISGRIEIGDRVLVPIQVGGRWRLFEREATAIGSNYIDVDALPVAPVVGEDVYPGGPSSAALITAVESYFDQLGPGFYAVDVGVQFEGYFHRHPAPSETAPAAARAAGIVDAAMGVAGTANVTVDISWTDVVPPPLELVQLGKLTLLYES